MLSALPLWHVITTTCSATTSETPATTFCNHKNKPALNQLTPSSVRVTAQLPTQCDKIKRRRSSLIGTLRLANSSTLEDAGLQITIAV